MSIGPWQIVLIVILVLIFFGPQRIPGLGKSIGEAIRGFKRGINDDEEKSQNAQLEKNSAEEVNTSSKEKEKEKEKET